MNTYLTAPDLLSSTFLEFIKELAGRYQPLQILRFGYRKLESTRKSCLGEDFAESRHQHFLLMITESNVRIDHDAQDYANTHYAQGTISLLCYGRTNIEEAISNNSRFFISVMNRGQLLYSRDGLSFQSSVTAYNPKNGVTRAQNHVHHRMPLAIGFLRGAERCIAEEKYDVATFMLHQCLEQCTILLIRVFLGYRSQLHNLRRQLLLCNCFSAAPYLHFLSGRKEDERLFGILIKSYCDARYNDEFEVGALDADAIYVRVSSFYKLTRLLCNKYIKGLKKQTGTEVTETGESEANNG
jgi:hypothetical protein